MKSHFLKNAFFALLIATLATSPAKAEKLKDIPEDGGMMMGMALLAANSGLAASKIKMAQNIKSKYGVIYEGSNLTYNENEDLLNFRGALKDSNTPTVFGRDMCLKFINEARENIKKTLSNKEAVEPFLSTYYIMSGTPPKINSAMLKQAIIDRMVISADISTGSRASAVSCSGRGVGTDVQFAQK